MADNPPPDFRKRLIAALIELDKHPSANVTCPKCDSGRLRLEDILSEGRRIGFMLICDRCQVIADGRAAPRPRDNAQDNAPATPHAENPAPAGGGGI